MELSCREDGLLDVSLEMEVWLLRDGLYSMLPSHHMVPIDSSPFPYAIEAASIFRFHCKGDPGI